VIEQKGFHSLLPHLIAFGGLSGLSSSMPSWAPNWSRKRNFSYGRTSSQVYRNEGNRFHADVRIGGDKAGCKQPKMNVVILGEVETINDLWLRKGSGNNLFEYSSSWDIHENTVVGIVYATCRIFGLEHGWIKQKNPAALKSDLSPTTANLKLSPERDWKQIDHKTLREFIWSRS